MHVVIAGNDGCRVDGWKAGRLKIEKESHVPAALLENIEADAGLCRRHSFLAALQGQPRAFFTAASILRKGRR